MRRSRTSLRPSAAAPRARRCDRLRSPAHCLRRRPSRAASRRWRVGARRLGACVSALRRRPSSGSPIDGCRRPCCIVSIGSKSVKAVAASVISSTCFLRSAISASRIASWNWPWNSDAMRRILPIHWPTVRSTPGSSFGPIAISATTPMTTSSLQPMSNMDLASRHSGAHGSPESRWPMLRASAANSKGRKPLGRRPSSSSDAAGAAAISPPCPRTCARSGRAA